MTGKNTPENELTAGQLSLEIENIGGIREADLIVPSGVTLLSGQNASNKSSTLRALAGVLGGPIPPLKSDADSGSVRLTVDGAEYYLDLTRRDGDAVVQDARTYADDTDLCELFAALTEMNPIRQAVLSDDDLYELLMRPVDTDEIQREIRRLTERKASLDDQLEELDKMENRLPGLRTRRNSVRDELDEVEASLADRRSEVEAIESDLDQRDVSSELSEKRSERRELQRRIRTHDSAVDSLSDKLESIDEQLDAFEVSESADDIEQLAEEIESLHQQKQQLTSTINALSPIAEMNSQILDEEDDIPAAMKSDDVVAELDPDSQSVTCWTCGSTVERAQIADQVSAVQEIIREKRDQRDSITTRIQTLTQRKRSLESERAELEDLRERREEISTEIETRRQTRADLREERRTLETEISELQRDHGEETDSEARLNELYDEISDLEYERGQLSNDLDRIEAEIDEIETALAEREDLETEREAVAADLREQRDRIDEIEQDLVGTFNEIMQRVLDTLAYDSVERIWIERRSTETKTSPRSAFTLHLVRATDSGQAYDDTVDSLSKSEREVIGLVVALAGYLVHDVGDDVPVIVIDAIEMFDADRIHGLLEHFSQHAEFVIASVLPEEQNELSGLYDSISTASLCAD